MPLWNKNAVICVGGGVLGTAASRVVCAQVAQVFLAGARSPSRSGWPARFPLREA
jgi:hypothetical protein